MSLVSIFNRASKSVTSLREGLRECNLDYLAKKVPAYARNTAGELVEAPETFLLATSQGRVLKGSVGADYRVAQHRDVLDIADSLQDAGVARVARIGAYGANGVFAVLSLPGVTEVAVGDNVAANVILVSRHGIGSNFGLVVRERLYCSNQIPSLLAKGRAFRFQHSGDISAKLAFATAKISVAADATREESEIWRRLAGTRVTLIEARALIAKWVAPEGDIDAVRGGRAVAATVEGLFDHGTGNHGATHWDVLNGITEYLDHSRARYARSAASAQRLVQSSLEGDTGEKRERALRLLATHAGIEVSR